MRFLFAMLGVGLCGSMATALPRLPPTPSRPNEAQRLLIVAVLEGTSNEQIKALDALLASGKNAPYVPLLRRLLETTEHPEVRSYAARALGVIGPEAKEALPELRKHFRDHGRRAHDYANAIIAIAEGNDPEVLLWFCTTNTEGRSKSPINLRPTIDKYPATVIPLLGDFLRDDDTNLRYRALRHLKTFSIERESKSGPKTVTISDVITGDARTKLLQQLRAVVHTTESSRGQVPALRFLAADIALRLDPTLVEELLPLYLLRIRTMGSEPADFNALVQANPTIPRRLVAHFDDPNPAFRSRLMHTFRSSNSPHVKQALEAGLHHRNPLVRDGVLMTIMYADHWARALAPQLAPLLRDPSPEVRLRAATIWRQHQPKDTLRLVPVLTDLATSAPKDIQRDALLQLTILGPQARDARPALLRLTRQPHLETRFLAAEALFTADPTTTATVINAFAAVVEDPKNDHCERAIKLLGQCGPAAKSVVACFKPALEFHDLRIHACFALWQIDPTTFTDHLNIFNQALNTVDSECELVLDLLPKFGTAAKPLIPALKTLMHNEDDDEYAAKAATAVITLDPKDAEEAYLMFRGVLANTRSASTMWLRQMRELGPAAKPLLPELITAIRSPRPNTKRYAIETLGVLGPDAKDALPVLREAAKTTPNVVYLDEAIKKIEGKAKP